MVFTGVLDTDFLDTELLNYLIAIAAVVYAVVLWFRSREKYGQPSKRWKRCDLYPAEAFFRELSKKDSEKGSDKPLIAMLHSSLLAVSEKGIIRGLARCISANHGTFVSFDYPLLHVEQNENSCHMKGKAFFSLHQEPIEIEVGWIKGDTDTKRRDWTPWSIVCFNVAAPPGQPMRLISFIEPEDFTVFGEKVVRSLVNRTPSFAFEVMVDQLRAKYKGPNDVARVMAPVLASCEGLRDRFTFNCKLASSAVREDPERIELAFIVEGRIKDLKISLSFCIVDMQCFLARYSAVVHSAED